MKKKILANIFLLTLSLLFVSIIADTETLHLEGIPAQNNPVGSTLSSGNVWVGDSGNRAVSRAMSGDIAISNTGVTTISADSVALTTDTTGNYIATITNGSGISGSSSTEGGTPTIALSNLTADWTQTGAYDLVLSNASSELKILESVGATYYSIFDVGDLSSDQTFNFNVGGTIYTSGNDPLDTISEWQSLCTTCVDLTSDVTGTLSVINGGTGVTSSTGTGSVVLNTSPTFVAPILGAASATSLAVPSITTASGALTITPASGSGLNIVLATTGDLAVNTSDIFVDTSSGYVGFGTNNVLSKVHIQLNTVSGAAAPNATYDVLTIDNDTTSYMNLRSSTGAESASGFLFSDDARGRGWIKYDHRSGGADVDRLVFGVAGAERMILDSVGNVGIGDSIPTEAKLVVGDAGAGDIYATFATANTETLCWDASGASLITDCTSLRKFKENIIDLKLEGINTVMKLKPREFDWKGKEEGIRHDLGFVAEEVNEVNSLLASYSIRDEKTKKAELNGVKYERMVALITKAMQEQQIIIVSLQKQIKLLQKQIKTVMIK